MDASLAVKNQLSRAQINGLTAVVIATQVASAFRSGLGGCKVVRLSSTVINRTDCRVLESCRAFGWLCRDAVTRIMMQRRQGSDQQWRRHQNCWKEKKKTTTWRQLASSEKDDWQLHVLDGSSSFVLNGQLNTKRTGSRARVEQTWCWTRYFQVAHWPAFYQKFWKQLEGLWSRSRFKSKKLTVKGKVNHFHWLITEQIPVHS